MKNYLLSRLSILFIFYIFTSHSLHGAQNPINTNWHELETDHFYIIYDDSLKDQIMKLATFAEMAHEELMTIYNEAPDKTALLFLDNTDFANGFATFLPYPYIVIYPVLPHSDDSISYYENWMYEVILHEYTHILTFEPSNSFYSPLRYLFGSVVKPNALLPLWYQEGSAVLMETAFTKYGRLRSPLYSAQLRAYTQDDLLERESFDQINSTSVPTWPYGQRPYFFGSLITNEIAQKKDLKSIGLLNQSYSKRIPFLIQNPAKEIVGKNYFELFDEFKKNLKQKAKDQIARIKKHQNYKLIPLDIASTSQTLPRISPDGSYLAYIDYEKYSGTTLKILKRKPNGEFFPEEKDVLKVTSVNRQSFIDWHPNSKKIIFNKAHTFLRRFEYFDLFEYDLETQKVTQLTSGERAFQATYSKDGNQIIYVKNAPNSNAIYSYNFKDHKHTLLVKRKAGIRYSYPIFIDKNRVLFVYRSNNGLEVIRLFNTKTQKYERTAMKGYKFKKILKSQNGLLVFDDANGTTNVSFTNNILRTPQPITNTVTKVYDAEIDPINSHLYTSELTSNDVKLFKINKYLAQTKTALKPLVNTPESIKNSDLYSRVKKSIKNNPKPYNGLSYLLPRYWIPFIYPVDGGTLYQGSTTASDPLGKQNLALEASYDTVTQKPSYTIGYLYRGDSIHYLAQHSVINNFLTASNSTVTDGANLLSVSFYPFGDGSHSIASVGVRQIDTTTSTQKYQRVGPSLGYSYDNPSTDNWAKGGFDHTLTYINYIEGEQYTSYDKFTYLLNQYITSITPKRHQLLFQLKLSSAQSLLNSDLIALGDRTTNGNYLANLLTSNFLMRGYPSGEFIGREMANINIEYSFPVFDAHSGFDSIPLFLKKVRGSFFVDSINLEGAFYDFQQKGYYSTKADKNFLSYGLEFRLSTTIGWHLPMDIILGAHYGQDISAGGGSVVPFVGLGITGFGGLSENKIN